MVATKKVKRAEENYVLEISEEEEEMLEEESVVRKKPEVKISITPPHSPGSSSTPCSQLKSQLMLESKSHPCV